MRHLADAMLYLVTLALFATVLFFSLYGLASASTTCTDLGNGFTQCYNNDPEPDESTYSTCYWINGMHVCEDQN